ncbi:MAG: glycosyltransferase [Candidatus Cloacimonetes bacterium]|nr:glycosyltransferase [Candidatus Cloacimonadota bacterium]
MQSAKIKCSIGIIAYNEEKIIGKLLKSLQEQKLEKVIIDEIIVVSSASTDDTDKIVKSFSEDDDRIKLIVESERNGKSSAINNFIKHSQNEILIIESGDTIPAANTVEKMISAFSDENIGMTGGRPIPENRANNFIGYSVNLLWKLHHKMALISPKLGEMIAFRKIFDEIPIESAVDEASIESQITSAGLQKKYIPEAIIHNKGPETIKDFIKQRRRIATGHIWLKDSTGYKVSSMNSSLLLKLMWEEIVTNPSLIFYLLGTLILEQISRILGWIDYKILKKNPFKWDMVQSTKNMKYK